MNALTSLVADRSGDLLHLDRSGEDLSAFSEAERLAVAALRRLSIDPAEPVIAVHGSEIEPLAAVAPGVAAVRATPDVAP